MKLKVEPEMIWVYGDGPQQGVVWAEHTDRNELALHVEVSGSPQDPATSCYLTPEQAAVLGTQLIEVAEQARGRNVR